MTGKIALVTGSNTGIGYISVRELARKGAHVIATTRSMAKGEDAMKRLDKELAGVSSRGRVEYLQLDLASFKNVVQFSQQVKNYEKLDILILNAGVMFPPFQLTEDGFESQIGTVSDVLRLCFIDLMRFI
jgi:NAD(P)-dependent dehydrogenase (short-subunit alcohol dehydrogenase family)